MDRWAFGDYTRDESGWKHPRVVVENPLSEGSAIEVLNRGFELRKPCQRCGGVMLLFPFCCEKWRLGYVGRLQCQGCKKVIFVDRETCEAEFKIPLTI